MAFSITLNTMQLDKPILQSLTSTGVETALHEPGYVVRSDDGREFMYVQNDSSGVAAVAGAPCVFAATTADDEYVVTPDVSDGSLVSVGAYLSILADTYFGWIQTKGLLVDAPCTDGAGAEVAAGDPVCAAVDAKWTKATVGTNHVGGNAIMAGSSGYANVMLK